MALASLGSLPGQAHELETVGPAFEHAITTAPGKSLVAVVVSYPPGGRSPAHRHACSAFICAHVPTGTIWSGLGGEPAKVYRVGESFFEEPGVHHRVGEYASDSDAASLLDVFIVDARDKPLTVPDPEAATTS